MLLSSANLHKKLLIKGIMKPQICFAALTSQHRSKTGGRSKNDKSTNNSSLSQSSATWLRRQRKDKYAKKAREEGAPSRAFYKLEQIDQIANQKRSKYEQKLRKKNSSNVKSMTGFSSKRKRGLFMEGDVVIGESHKNILSYQFLA